MGRKRINKLPDPALSSEKNYNCIDLVKFILVFFICVIHIPPFQTGNLSVDRLNFWMQNCVSRIAVPFYFVVSGFLLFRKTSLGSPDTDRVKRYCFKLLRLLGTWYFLLFAGERYHLWYFGALVAAVFILTALFKKGVKLWIIALISAAFYVISMLGDAYHGLVEPLKNVPLAGVVINGYDNIFYDTFNGIFLSIIFVLMGALFAHKRVLISKAASAAGFVLSMAALFAEVFLLRHLPNAEGHSTMLSLIPAVYFLFSLTLHINLKDRPVYARMRVVGMLMFLSHLLVNFFVSGAIEYLKNSAGVDLSSMNFLISVGLAFALAVLIERLSQKEKLKWLRYLYS